MRRALSVICIDEKKEPVLDYYVSGAQSKILLNLVSGSILLLATIVGEEEGTYQMLCAGKVEESKGAIRYMCNAVEDTSSIDAVQRTGQRTKKCSQCKQLVRCIGVIQLSSIKK